MIDESLNCSNCVNYSDDSVDEDYAFCTLFHAEIPKIPHLVCARRNFRGKKHTRDGVVIKAMRLTECQDIYDMLNSRSMVGIEKYGVTLEEANLSKEQLLQHALEELTDCTNYFVAAQEIEWAKKIIQIAEITYLKKLAVTNRNN